MTKVVGFHLASDGALGPVVCVGAVALGISGDVVGSFGKGYRYSRIACEPDQEPFHESQDWDTSCTSAPEMRSQFMEWFSAYQEDYCVVFDGDTTPNLTVFNFLAACCRELDVELPAIHDLRTMRLATGFSSEVLSESAFEGAPGFVNMAHTVALNAKAAMG